MKIKRLGIILLILLVAMLVIKLDIGINDWPNPHNINIGQGLIQIVPLDIMISLDTVFIIVAFLVFAFTTLRKEFMKGLRGEEKENRAEKEYLNGLIDKYKMRIYNEKQEKLLHEQYINRLVEFVAEQTGEKTEKEP
jgi:hypothetical protein